MIFFILEKKYKCILQIGGSDQWGNIVNGVDLIKKIDNSKNAYGLTTAFALLQQMERKWKNS